MPYEEIQTEDYKFMNFSQFRSSVIFDVVPIEGRDVTDDDKTKISKFLHEMGNWESVVKAGLYLLSELNIFPVDQLTLQNYKREFEIGKYTVDIEITHLHQRLTVTMRLSREERHRREATETTPTLEIQEIYKQLKNIPKWKALEKAMKLARRSF